MESDEEIYVNIEELQGNADEHYRPKDAGKPVFASVSCTPAVTKPVRIEASAEVKPQTRPLFKVSTVCLGLLCLLLLTAVLAVSVLYDRDFYQLSRDLANQTAEKHQLLIQNQNLTDERERVKHQLKNLTEIVGSCPHGWRRLGCSCYLFVRTFNTWSSSRWLCQNQGAELVIAKSQREMMFLNTFGAHLMFWIGLNQASRESQWMWIDGSSLETGYWIVHHMRDFSRKPRCAAFNSFTGSAQNIRSWTAGSCNQYLQSVCEKKVDV